ncbi:MAG: hypothetical protein ACYS47_18255, partial [Planctomycetota bacterium]
MNDPLSPCAIEHLLDRFPFPTLFPLAYLHRLYDVSVRREACHRIVRLAREGAVREYWLEPGSFHPQRIVRFVPKTAGSVTVRWLERDGDLTFTIPGIDFETRLNLRPLDAGLPPSRLGPNPFRFGVLRPGPIWNRLLKRNATVHDLVQLACSEEDVLARMEFLKRAQALAPVDPAVTAWLADTLAALGRRTEAEACSAHLEALLPGLPDF